MGTNWSDCFADNSSNNPSVKKQLKRNVDAASISIRSKISEIPKMKSFFTKDFLTEKSFEAIETSDGFMFPEFAPNGLEIRKRFLRLEKMKSGRDLGMFLRKLRPYKALTKQKAERIIDEEEIRKSVLFGKNSTYAEELEFFEKEYEKKEVIDFFTNYPINRKQNESVKHIIFISDLHLCSLGITSTNDLDAYFAPIKANLVKVLESFGLSADVLEEANIKKEIEEEEDDDILFVFLGDQTDFGSDAEFMMFKIFLQKMNIKNACVIPGNHDNSSFFGNYLRTRYQCRNFSFFMLGMNENVLDSVEYYPKDLDVSKDVRLILLDSTKVGEEYHVANGKIGKEQRRKLGEILKKSKDKSCIICLHHHPKEGGTLYRLGRLESLGTSTEEFEAYVTSLEDTEEVLEVINNNVKEVDVVFGHLHKPFFKVENGIRFRNIGSLQKNNWDKKVDPRMKLGPNKNCICTCFNIQKKQWKWT